MNTKERLKYGSMPIYELCDEAVKLKREYKDHYDNMRFYKDGLNEKLHELHKKEYRRKKRICDHIVSIIKSRQKTLDL